MRVLITGSQGYLGTVMAPMVQAAGHEVIGLDTGWFAPCVLGNSPLDPPTIRCDVRDVGIQVLAGFDAVIHLAALSNDPLGALNPDVTFAINYRACVRLARLARAAGVSRFLYASTCSVYGSAGDDLVDESAPLRPLTPYAESKVRVEEALTELADSHFTPVFLRNATAFGVSPRLRADIVLNNLVGHAVLHGVVRVMSDGTPLRPLVHARDIATAFLAALEAPREQVNCLALNVGDERNNLSVAEIADAAVRAVPGARICITGETGPDPRSYRVDFSRIRSALPTYSAQWSVSDGATELAEAYRAAQLTAADFASRFTRLPWLRGLQNAGALSADLESHAATPMSEPAHPAYS